MQGEETNNRKLVRIRQAGWRRAPQCKFQGPVLYPFPGKWRRVWPRNTICTWASTIMAVVTGLDRARCSITFSRARGDRIGLCLDTAWALDAREDPIAMAERYADRLYGVHIKDFVFDRAREPEDVIVGQGNLDLPRLAELIESNENVKMVVLEYEGDVDNPVPALTKCVQAVGSLS